MKKKVIILDCAGKRQLANQLWNFVSIYAYCLEKGFDCVNPSFFKYANLFNFPQLFIKGPRSNDYYSLAVKKLFPNKIIATDLENVFYLPPTENSNRLHTDLLMAWERSNNTTLYLSGWLFRNPVGLEKYHTQIVKAFAPKKHTQGIVNEFILPLRKKYKKIVGVHIRQKDYRSYKSGRLYFHPSKVLNILKDYLSFFKLNSKETMFVICSDEIVDLKFFKGLVVKTGIVDKIAEDMFILAKTDLIIGSDSTYGAFASYYGKVPFMILGKNGCNWSKLKDSDSSTAYCQCKTVHP